MAEQLQSIDPHRYVKLEQRMFNTGPYAQKHPPQQITSSVMDGTSAPPPPTITTHVSGSVVKFESGNEEKSTMRPPVFNNFALSTSNLSNERPGDLNIQLQAPIPGMNEMSMSSAGSSSDREPDTPDKNNVLPPQQPCTSTAAPAVIISSGGAGNSRTGSAKRVRKRKQNSSDHTPGRETAPKKSAKKITDFLGQGSPQRTGGTRAVNGENGSVVAAGPNIDPPPTHGNFANQFMPISPSHTLPPAPPTVHTPTMTVAPVVGGYTSTSAIPTTTAAQQQQQQQLYHQQQQLPQRTTPNHLVAYVSSDSNQSPPGRQMCEVQVQTDITDDGEAVRSELAKKTHVVEELQRVVEESKVTLNSEKRKIDAARETIRKLLIQQSTMERKQAKTKCMEESLRLGQFKPERHGEHFQDTWTVGYAFEELEKKIKQIATEREDITNASASLRKRKPTSGAREREVKRAQQQAASGVVQLLPCPSPLSSAPSSSSGSAGLAVSGATTANASFSDDGFARPEPPPLTLQEYYEQEEIYRLRKEQLKREEQDIQEQHKRLDGERNVHIRELKRVQCEEQSQYKNHSLLFHRYQLLSLLGKGGFSEVWHAFDLEECRYVACKIHHVNKDWKDDKKANYVKHALREKDIHKTLVHPRIVQLFDLFTIDNHTFCTVLEYCDGNDLDFYMKQHKTIPEKEARSIIMQVCSALKYLNDIKPPVIHYDLKPANILLQSGTTSGAIKITDFGLSKVMEDADDNDSGIELTSQGAGTYWYLPPETFVIGHQPPKISSKVDIWSIGVILYQCLYGKRPFGHEQTQAKILENHTILKATEVHFPSKPNVTSTAQDFIRRCLQYNKEERADVNELLRHDFFKPRGQKSLTNSASSSNLSGMSASGGGATPTTPGPQQHQQFTPSSPATSQPSA